MIRADGGVNRASLIVGLARGKVKAILTVMIQNVPRLRSWPPCLAVLSALVCPVLIHGAPAETDPLTPRAHFMSGKLYLGQKLHDQAEEQIRMAVEGDTTNAGYRAWWAVSLCEVAGDKFEASGSISDLQGRIQALRLIEPLYRNAHAQFTRAVELDPEEMKKFCFDHRVHYWVDAFKQAEGMYRNRNYEEAHEALQLLVVLDPEEPQAFLTMAHCLDKLDRQHEAVEKAESAVQLALARIAESNCDALRTRNARLDCTRRRDQHQQIVTNVDSFLRSRNLVLGNRAFDASMAVEGAEERRRHLGDAVLYFEKSLAVDSGLDLVRFRLGNAYYALAETYSEEGDTARARTYFRRSATEYFQLAATDSVSESIKEDALFNGRNALYDLHAWDELLPWLKLSVDLDPREVAPYRRVAECMAELKRSNEAVSYLMMCNALSENGVLTDTGDIVAGVRASLEANDESAALREFGAPDEVRSYREMDSGRTIRTWIWWTRGAVRHFVEGRNVGGISFAPAGG